MNVTVKDLIENSDILTEANSYGFCDWFCNDRTLKKRAIKLIPAIKFLVKQGIINPEKTLITFKNCCPINGLLYDIIFFSDLSDNTLGGLSTRSGHYRLEKKCEIWYNENNNTVFKKYTNWKELKKNIKSNDDNIKDELIRFFKK